MKPIRIGTSVVLSPESVDTDFYVAEVRRYWYENIYNDYRGAIKKCIDNDVYLIFNQCLGCSKTLPHPEHWPTEREWRDRIEDNVRILLSSGGNKNNCRVTLINEPTKYLRVENGYGGVGDLIYLTNIAYDQIAGRFELGVGNMEFYDAMVLGDWYRYLCKYGNFEWLDIHIQNSCDNDAHTREYTDYAKGLANMYGKKLSCTESTHTRWDVAGSDYQKVLMQLSHAERIGCVDFCPIFLNRDTKAVLQKINANTMEDDPCFKVDGYDRSNGNYTDLKRIADEKHPTPNIIEMEEEDMKLDDLYYEGRPEEKYVRDPDKRGIMFFRKCFKLSDSNIFDCFLTDAIRAYQTTKGMLVDGKVGPETFGGLILEADYQKFYNWIQHDWATHSK